MTSFSQVSCIGKSQPKTWDDYAEGCIATYRGGHRGSELEAFRHGMGTVFNLLRAEFPTAEQCKASKELLAACEAALADGPHNASYGLSSRVVEQLRAAISQAQGSTT